MCPWVCHLTASGPVSVFLICCGFSELLGHLLCVQLARGKCWVWKWQVFGIHQGSGKAVLQGPIRGENSQRLQRPTADRHAEENLCGPECCANHLESWCLQLLTPFFLLFSRRMCMVDSLVNGCPGQSRNPHACCLPFQMVTV